ncbi:MAG: response regulator transcription factor [Actinomycetota bacterium]
MAPVRVVLADDHLLIREGVAALLNSIDDVDVVAEADDHDSLLTTVAEHRPDVVVTDIRMPPTNTDEGIVAALAIREEHPDTAVLVLSQFAEPSFVVRLFENGSDHLGYLLKDRISRGDLERAIAALGRGESAVDPKIVEVLVAARVDRDSPVDALTPREREVLSKVAEGGNNASVAAALHITDKAVAKHINSIFSKLGLGEADDTNRRVKAVLIWLSQ